MRYKHIFLCLLLMAWCGASAQTHPSAIESNAYYPRNLTECMIELKKTLSPSVLNRLKSEPEEVTHDYHFTIGLWIRNNWIRGRGGGTLTQYFNNLGIYAPDDMSGIILTSLWRDLHSQPIRLDEQVREYKQFWFYNAPEVADIRSVPDELWNKELTVHTTGTIKLAKYRGQLILLCIFADDPPSESAFSNLNSLCKEFLP